MNESLFDLKHKKTENITRVTFPVSIVKLVKLY